MDEDVSDLERLAYLAGVFDGEGSVVFHHNNSRTLSQLRVGMNDESVVVEFYKSFGGGLSSGQSGDNTQYIWTINGEDAVPVAEAFSRYCIEKHDQLLLYLRIRRDCMFTKGKAIPHHELEKRARYHHQMKELK